MGEFQSGQMGQTVNLLAMPSVVRIHLPPPNKRDIRMDVSFIWRENRGGFEPRALRNVPVARFNPRRPARRQANPPYLLPAYTLGSRARKSLENVSDPNRDPNADRSGKHRTVFARCFPRLSGFFLSDSCLCRHESADFSCRISLHISCCMAVCVQREARRVVTQHT